MTFMEIYNEYMSNILLHLLINERISKRLKLFQRTFEELCSHWQFNKGMCCIIKNLSGLCPIVLRGSF